MPRQARRKSASGIYHIMLRGINQQVIFEDDDDGIKFIETLMTYKAICGYKIFAYCLMGNHCHLLIKAEKEDLVLIFKRIAGSYVYWYNWKYHRRGHLFQDRFKSEPVENDSYFLTVLRYIHQNPVKIGMKIDGYRFSSYNDYINRDNSLVDIDFALSIMGMERFAAFNNEKNDDKCLDYDEGEFRLSDSEAKAIIEKVSKCKDATAFQKLELTKRNKYIRKLREKGLSIRQISRLTGVSKGVVERL